MKAMRSTSFLGIPFPPALVTANKGTKLPPGKLVDSKGNPSSSSPSQPAGPILGQYGRPISGASSQPAGPILHQFGKPMRVAKPASQLVRPDGKAIVASNSVIGYANGTTSDAVKNVSHVDHAGRHLSDFGVIPGKQGTTAFRDAVRSAAVEVPENPIKTFDHVMAQGGQAVKGCYGKVNGKDVVFFVTKDPRGKIGAGDLVTAITPTPQQMIN